MNAQKGLGILAVIMISASLTACGKLSGPQTASDSSTALASPGDPDPNNTIWSYFVKKPDQSVQVNRHLWSASLDVLSFLPVQSVDPFTGVIVTGYGTPPGGGRAYRATVHINDPALDARSLNVSLHSKSGPVSASTTRAVEDAILSRARQLRIADKKL